MSSADPLKPDSSENADLEQRLATYRARVAGEGRKSAVRVLDKAIAKARRLAVPPEPDEGQISRSA